MALEHVSFSAAVTVSSAAEATPDDVVSCGALEFDGNTLNRIEFFSPRVDTAAAASSFVVLNLWDGSTDLGRIALVGNGAVTAESVSAPVYVASFLTPARGTHTYKVRAWRITGNGAVYGGAPNLPGYIRVSRA